MDKPPVRPFHDCGDGSYIITLPDGRSFQIRDAVSSCPYCHASTTMHLCRPIDVTYGEDPTVN